MAFDGSGVYTVLYNWATEAASPPIAISKLDSEFAGIATGLTQCLLRSGGTLTGGLTIASGSGLTVTSTQPEMYLNETDAAADEKVWRIVTSGGNFYLYTMTDALAAGNNCVSIVRTGTTVDSITFAGTTVAVTGNQTISGSLTIGGSAALTAASGAAATAGSFTMELATDSSGGSVLASGTAYWKRIGNLVTLRMPCLTATTTDSSLYLRAIPAAIQPSLTGTYIQCIPVVGQVDSATSVVGIYVEEAVAYWSIAGIPVNFSGSSSVKGIGISGNYGAVITYQVSD